jgi:hypothetical protein
VQLGSRDGFLLTQAHDAEGNSNSRWQNFRRKLPLWVCTEKRLCTLRNAVTNDIFGCLCSVLRRKIYCSDNNIQLPTNYTIAWWDFRFLQRQLWRCCVFWGVAPRSRLSTSHRCFLTPTRGR